MTWTIDPVKATPSIIDEYLGPGSHALWVKRTLEANAALVEWDKVRNMVPVRSQAYVTGLGSLDAGVLLKAGQDYSLGIQRIEKGQKVHPDQLHDIEVIRDMANDALEQQTGLLNGAMIVAGLNKYLVGMFNNAQQMAAESLPKIERLLSALKKAERNATEARAQQIINLSITVITTVFLPELTVIKRIGVAVGTWALDKSLGTDKSTSLGDEVSDNADYAEILAAGIEDWKWLSPAEKSTVKSASKGLSVVGLYFDQDEVNNALKQVEIVRAVLQEALASLKRVKALIERLRPGMLGWKQQLLHAARVYKEGQGSLDATRDQLRQEISAAGWTSSRTVTWRAA